MSRTLTLLAVGGLLASVTQPQEQTTGEDQRENPFPLFLITATDGDLTGDGVTDLADLKLAGARGLPELKRLRKALLQACWSTGFSEAALPEAESEQMKSLLYSLVYRASKLEGGRSVILTNSTGKCLSWREISQRHTSRIEQYWANKSLPLVFQRTEIGAWKPLENGVVPFRISLAQRENTR